MRNAARQRITAGDKMDRRALMIGIAIVVSVHLPAVAAKNIKIHGYVTQVNSPTSFEIEDYRIERVVQRAKKVEGR